MIELITFLPTPAAVKAAEDALQVQDACNGLGVLFAFTRHMEQLNKDDAACVFCNGVSGGLSTAERNQHPIAILFIDKLASLAGSNLDGVELMSKAWDAVTLLSQGKPADFPISRSS